MTSASILVPCKFLSLIMHLIITCCIIANYEDNILASNVSSTSSQWSTAKQNILAAMITSLIFLVIEIMILFVGINMYSDKLNIAETVAHGIGVILYSWFSIQSWTYTEIWTPWVFFTLCPFVLECYSALKSFLYYKKFKV